MTPFPIGRWLRLVERTGYALVFLPLVTDFLERRSWPHSVREYVTEMVLGILVLFYVGVIRWVRKRLERLEEDRKTLTALLIHDLKNPLTVVMGTLSHLQDHPDDVEQRKWIRAALRSCREDLELMNQLVEVDRLEGPGFSLSKGPVDVPELLRVCSEEISATAARKKVLFVESHGEEVSSVFADEGLLRRAIMNLARNALASMRDGGKLEIRADTRAGHLVVSVKDTGIGIPPEGLKKLFGRFSRIHSENRKGEEGWGLGLYFCKLVVEAHGGWIRVDSRPDEGTHVQFALPLQGAPAPAFRSFLGRPGTQREPAGPLSPIHRPGP